MFPEDQLENVKKQLFLHLDNSNLPNKEEIKKSVQEMNSEELKDFLIKNNLIQSSEKQNSDKNPNSTANQQCIFCSIIKGKIPTNQINENKDAIAVLEINPISYGHSIIIPKKHLNESAKLPASSFSLAKKIAKKIKTKFKPKEVTIISSNLFGHEIINILPVYENENLGSPRQQAPKEELEKLKNILEKKVKPKMIRKKEPKKIEKSEIHLPRRIP